MESDNGTCDEKRLLAKLVATEAGGVAAACKCLAADNSPVAAGERCVFAALANPAKSSDRCIKWGGLGVAFFGQEERWKQKGLERCVFAALNSNFVCLKNS